MTVVSVGVGGCYSLKHLQLETVEEAALKKKKSPYPHQSATPQIQKQNKTKPKITTATLLPLQQARPSTATKPTPTLQTFDS